MAYRAFVDRPVQSSTNEFRMSARQLAAIWEMVGGGGGQGPAAGAGAAPPGNAPASNPTSNPAGNPAANPTASDSLLALQLMLSLIPVISDGDIITSEHQNAIRSALILLAGAIGGSAPPGAVAATDTYAPIFQPVMQAGQQRPQWVIGLGVASKPAGEDADGWFPINLPNGAIIQSMSVSGARGGSVLSADVTLLRQTLASSIKTPMINISLKALNGAFKTPPAAIDGASPAIIDDFRTVNNDKYQYLIHAELNGAEAGSQVDLYGIQVTYQR